MILDGTVRSICCAGLCLLGRAAVSLPAMAGAASPMSVRLAEPEAPASLQAGAAGPKYVLRKCQVGQSFGACYDPYQMRIAYQVDSLINAGVDGRGHTIVIIDAFQSPNIVQQLNYYISYYGLASLNGLGNPPDPSLGTFTQIAPDGLTPFDPTDGNQVGWAEEISLDVTWAHAIAPGANIVLVLAKSNQDADLQSALNYAVTHNLGDVISQSYGENESCMDPTILSAQHDTFVAATQQGMTIFASAGDQGAALQTCDGNSWVQAVSTPAVDPLVTAVGGTELHAADFCLPVLGCDPTQNPSPGTYEGEIVWNEGPAPFGDGPFGLTLATGGGFSVLFDEPPYQQGTAGLHGGKQRALPDVTYNAAVYHGVLTYLNIPGLTPGFYRFGGTSAGSPQWAALTAIADQLAGKRLGFLNKAMYDAGKHKGAPFNDITSGTNSSFQVDSSNNLLTIIGYDAGPGWDATSGTGSPIGTPLAEYLSQAVSPGDGQAAISTSKPKPHPKPIVPGSKEPH